MRALFIVGSVLICFALISAGCVTSSHENSTITITNKFDTYIPNSLYTGMHEKGIYEYFIVTQFGETARVTKNVYYSVYKNNTYNLEWGYVAPCVTIDCKESAYGYNKILSVVL